MNQTLLDVADVMVEALATGLFVSLCTIQQPVPALNPDGTPISSSSVPQFTDVAGLVDIQCMKAPASGAEGIGADESRTAGYVAASGYYHVLLDANYPTLIDGWRAGWRAVIDGVQYNIYGVDQDSQSQMTRITAQRVTV